MEVLILKGLAHGRLAASTPSPHHFFDTAGFSRWGSDKTVRGKNLGANGLGAERNVEIGGLRRGWRLTITQDFTTKYRTCQLKSGSGVVST